MITRSNSIRFNTGFLQNNYLHVTMNKCTTNNLEIYQTTDLKMLLLNSIVRNYATEAYFYNKNIMIVRNHYVSKIRIQKWGHVVLHVIRTKWFNILFLKKAT